MKKLYMVFALLSCAIIVNAQYKIGTQGKNKTQTKTLNKNQVARHTAPASAHQTNSTLIWSDDFSNPLNWNISHKPGTVADWLISSLGPNGTYPIAPINTTGDFALFDSDALCDTDQVGWLTYAAPIDLTGHTNIRLSFNQYYRRYWDSTYIYVGTDTINWTRFEVNAGMQTGYYSGGGNNAPGPNPHHIDLDISTVAGGQDSVYIRFEFYSPDTNGLGPAAVSGCAYAWMIDDVSITDISNIDGGIMQAYPGEYGWVPIIQPEAIQLQGRIVNRGLTAIDGQVIFHIYDLNGLVFTDTSVTSGSLNPGDTSGFLSGSLNFIPTATGLYTLENLAYVQNDAEYYNDTTLIDFLVDSSIYARDLTSIDYPFGFFPAVSNPAGTGSIAQLYEFWHASDLTAATFYIDSVYPGDDISVEVYTVNNGLPATLIGTTGNYVMQPGDSEWVTLPFQAPINITTGTYAVVINQLDPHVLNIGLTSKIFTPAKTLIKTPAHGWATLEAASGFKLCAMLDLLNPASTLVGIKPVASNSPFKIYPNPASSYIYLAGNNQKNVTVEITNSIGQVVKTVNFESLHVDRVEIQDLPAGVYTVRVHSQNEQTVQTIIVK